MTHAELEAENEQLKRDNGLAVRIMEAIRKYSEGDKESLGGMGVPWVDELLAGLAGAKERADNNFASLERVKEKYSAAANELKQLKAENAAMRAALEIIRDPELAGKTWPELVAHLRLSRTEEVEGDGYVTAQGSCWRYACIADAALRGVPPGQQEPVHPTAYPNDGFPEGD